MSLQLPARRARLGAGIRFKLRESGEETAVLALIPVSFALDARELNDLLRIQDGDGRLFAQGDMPAMPDIRGFRLASPIEPAQVRFVLFSRGNPIPVECAGARLWPVDVSPFAGGKALCSMRVICAPTLDVNLLHLLANTGRDCEVQVKAEGWGAQTEMFTQGAA